MSKRDLVNEWLEIARDEYEAALFLFEKKHRKPLEVICYLCQQSVEKSLKGYLCAQDAEIPKIHALKVLCDLCGEFNREFLMFFRACEQIETYATGTRYPNRIEVDEHDAKAALSNASEVLKFVSEQIKKL